MRVLVLLLFVCFLLWGVAHFTGEPGTAQASAAEPTESAAALSFDASAAPGPSELAPAGAEPAPHTAGASAVPPGRFLAQPEPEPVGQGVQAEELPTDDGSLDWLGEPVRTSSVDRTELAAALLHLGPDEMREVLRTEAAAERVGEDEIRLYLAFTEALAGRAADARERARGFVNPNDLDSRELACLKAAFDSGATPVPASFSSSGPGLVGLAMSLRLSAREAERALARGEHARAALLLTEVLLGELDGPWANDRVSLERWSALLDEAQAGHRFDPQGDWPSIDLEVQRGDSLTALRVRALEARPGLLVNTGLINRVNGIGDRHLQPGEVVRVPTSPVRTVVDLSARWVLVFFGDEVGRAYECGIGAQETPTLLGDFSIGTKKENPPWFRVGEDPVPFGDPDNPLGTRWLGWEDENGRTSYGFHGTWEPETVGFAASLGCVRFRNEDVEQLYELLPRRSGVTVRR